jgi:hypothetical protein
MMTSVQFAKGAQAGLLAVALVQGAVGCDNDGPLPRQAVAATSANSFRPPTPPPATPAWHGYFSGRTFIGGSEYFLSQALVTVDGAMRVLVYGPYIREGNTVRLSERSASAQFVGMVSVGADSATGSGVLIGHPCASAGDNEFCGLVAPALVKITTGTRQDFDGTLTVVLEGQVEDWPFELSWADKLYLEGAATESIAGSRPMQLAEWAKHGEVIATVDDNGALFFQSAATGCVGNGSLTPHGDGEFNVYDAVLAVESCATQYAHLAGVFEGLATQTTLNSGFYCTFYYDDCAGLVLWLSTPDGAPRQRAITMWLTVQR